MAPQANISIVVEAIDQATKTLEGVKGTLGGMNSVTKGVASSMDKLSDRFTNF